MPWDDAPVTASIACEIYFCRRLRYTCGLTFLCDFTMHTRTKRLHELMAQHGLTSAAVAKILNRRTATVNMWRCRNSLRVIPETALHLLEFKLGAK